MISTALRGFLECGMNLVVVARQEDVAVTPRGEKRRRQQMVESHIPGAAQMA